ncbi:Cytochrome c oxidase polypeptide II [Candidatus Burkholderia humilis]|nr:Cytochrome c oxidase polypeptide II [Candidatus Burkholderia humilis]
MRLGWALAALVTAVALIVTGLLAGAIMRRRPPPTPRDANHVHGEGGGLHWVWIGTGISSVALFAALAYVLVTLESVASPKDEPRAQFDAWRASQAKAKAYQASNMAGDVHAGAELFRERYAGCHAVRGTDANGAQAPDLTHLNSRRLIAAGTLPNTEQNQLEWIRHAQRIKPDSLMPSITLSPADAAALAAYLRTLQ